MNGIAYILPDDVSYDWERQVLDVNGTKISLELLRHFHKDFVGMKFEIVKDDNDESGFVIRRLT